MGIFVKHLLNWKLVDFEISTKIYQNNYKEPVLTSNNTLGDQVIFSYMKPNTIICVISLFQKWKILIKVHLFSYMISWRISISKIIMKCQIMMSPLKSDFICGSQIKNWAFGSYSFSKRWLEDWIRSIFEQWKCLTWAWSPRVLLGPRFIGTPVSMSYLI